MRAGRRVDVTAGWARMDVATVPPLRSPTRLTAARKKKSGCSGRDDKSRKGDSQESSRRVARISASSFLRSLGCSNERFFPLPNHNDTEGGPVGGRAGGPGADGACRGPSAPWPTFARRELQRKSAIRVPSASLRAGGMTEKQEGWPRRSAGSSNRFT